MINLGRLEGWLENRIEGLFRRFFPRPVQPVDMARSLVREMGRQRRASVTATYVPNHYIITLSDRDYQEAAPLAGSLAGELGEFLIARAKEKKYTLVGTPQITFRMDPQLTMGEMTISSQFEEKPYETVSSDTQFLKVGVGTIPPLKPEEEPGWSLRVVKGPDQGLEADLSPYRLTLGRAGGNNMAFKDSQVSRHHAQVEWVNGSYFLVDLGSTNGTFVNGLRVMTKKLSPGDHIQLGETVLEVVPTGDGTV